MKIRDFKKYYRGSNIDEKSLIDSGQLHLSKNHLTNKSEIGISVSDTPKILLYFKYVCVVTGKEIGEGSDGEPLLDPKTMKFVRWVKYPKNS